MRTSAQHSNSRAANGVTGAAFSLLELLVVLAIIGILASIALPSMKGMRMSSGLAAASRQVLDDVSLARRFAIQNRTTVLMVFIPPVGAGPAAAFNPLAPNSPQRNILLRGQHTSYALFSVREVGDQPGRSNPRYLKSWTALPDGFLIPEWKFTSGAGVSVTNFTTRDVTELAVKEFFTMEVPVPTLSIANPARTAMPYIAFGPDGRLQKYNSTSGNFEDLNEDEIIPLARGSIFLERDETAPKLTYRWLAPDVIERPAGNSTNNYNLVVIDHVTGRGRVVRPEIP